MFMGIILAICLDSQRCGLPSGERIDQVGTGVLGEHIAWTMHCSEYLTGYDIGRYPKSQRRLGILELGPLGNVSTNGQTIVSSRFPNTKNDRPGWFTKLPNSAVHANVQANARDPFSDAVKLVPTFATTSLHLFLLRSYRSLPTVSYHSQFLSVLANFRVHRPSS